MKRETVVLILLTLLAAAAMAPAAEAGNHSNARENAANVGKRPPSAGPPDLSANDDEAGQTGVQVQPTAGGNRSVSLSATISDGNGHNDVQSVTITVYKPDNSTVHVSPFPASKSSGTGKQAVYDALFTMAHHDAAGIYPVKVEASDRDSDTTTSWGQIEYVELAAVTIGESTIVLNPDGDENSGIEPGTDTRSNPSTATITNGGNVPIDVELSGTDLTNADESATIAVSNIVYSTSATFDTETALSGTATRLALNLAPGASSSTLIYFAADIPEGTRADTYTGTATLAAVVAT